MTEKFKGKYRIKSVRLQSWDYGSNAAYFVTICTHSRICFFGTIKNKRMFLSDIGLLAEKYLNEIPLHFPYVKLQNHVVMPNHIHGIIIIDKPDNDNGQSKRNEKVNSIQLDDRTVWEDTNISPISEINPKLPSHPSLDTGQKSKTEKINPSNQFVKKPEGGMTKHHNPMLHENLSRIIRWYKGRVSFESHKINLRFSWQARFHEHIIGMRVHIRISRITLIKIH